MQLGWVGGSWLALHVTLVPKQSGFDVQIQLGKSEVALLVHSTHLANILSLDLL